jgi:peroxiredoxin
MKKTTLFLCLISAVIIMGSFTDNNTYVIRGTTDVKEGVAILNNYVTPDTVRIKDGKFEFRGNTAKATYISFEIPPSRPTRMILEPGEITVIHSKKDGYRLGGSPNNIRFQKMEDQIKPYNDKFTSLWGKYNRAEGDERIKIWREYDQAKTDKIEKTRELVKQDPSYAGFLQMLPIQNYETAGNLKYYLEEFKAFEDDQAYKRLAGYYRGVANTDVGIAPPAFTLPDPDGKMIALSSFKGKYVLLDFWYSGCGWCRKMTPGLIKIYADLKKKGFEIISISVDPKNDEIKWIKAMEEDKAPWMQLWDKEKTLPEQYGITGYPTMFFLDKKGKVLQRIFGYHDEPILKEIFTRYIK